MGQNLTLYLDDYDANTNPNDKIDINISSLQIPDYSSATNRYLKVNSSNTLVWEDDNSISSGQIVGKSIRFYINTTAQTHFDVDVSTLQNAGQVPQLLLTWGINKFLVLNSSGNKEWNSV